MDNDSHFCQVDFDANYCNLVEQYFTAKQSDDRSQSEPCIEPVTTRPQGSCPHTAEHFRAKFEAMEKAFREEFLSTSHKPDDGETGSRPAQVINQSINQSIIYLDQ